VDLQVLRIPRGKTLSANKRAAREKEKLLKAEDEVKSQGLSTDKK